MPSLPKLRTGTPRRERGMIRVDHEIELPFGVVEGAKDGPCLLVTAGIHGSEFCSIEAVPEPAPPISPMTLTFVSSPRQGLWYPYQTIGAKVAKDQPVGEIRNLLGRCEDVIGSPRAGRVLFQMTSLSANEGEALLGVGADR